MASPSGPILLPTTLTPMQQACVDLLEESLAVAKTGDMSSVGIIVCLKDGFASVMAGTQAANLNLGCDELKRKILDEVTGGNVQRTAAPKSSILRAR